MNKESFIIGCIRRLREYGEGMILADQSISSIKEVVKSCVYTIICLSQTSQKDRKEAANMLGLNSRLAEITHMLEVGECVIRLAGRYPFCQLLTTPLIEPKHISENEIDKINTQDERIKNLLGKVKSKKIPEPSEHEKQETKNSQTDKSGDNIKKYLWAVYTHQYKKTKTEIYTISGLKTGTADRVSNKCERENLIKIIKPSFGKSKFPILLAQGYKLLGLDEKKPCGKGASEEHVLWQYQINEHFSVFNPTIERFRGGKHMDVAFENNSLFIAIEVAMTSVHEKVNIEKDFYMAKVDYLVTACANQKVEKDVNDLLNDFSDDIKKKTKICLIKNLLKQKPEDFLLFLKN